MNFYCLLTNFRKRREHVLSSVHVWQQYIRLDSRLFYHIFFERYISSLKVQSGDESHETSENNVFIVVQSFDQNWLNQASLLLSTASEFYPGRFSNSPSIVINHHHPLFLVIDNTSCLNRLFLLAPFFFIRHFTVISNSFFSLYFCTQSQQQESEVHITTKPLLELHVYQSNKFLT